MAIATLTIDINAKLANLERDMGKAAHIAEANAKRMSDAFAVAGRSLAAIGATLSVGAFAAMVKDVAEVGDQLQKLSVKTGVAVEELSKLQYAASLSDLSNEDLGASLIRLNRIMGEAAGGSKEATEALARFGIAPDSGLSAADAFKTIADRVKATGDETKIASAMNDVFGKSFANLLPLLKSGSEGLKDSADELERMGGVMSGELAAASERFNDNLTRIGKSLDALKVESLSGVVAGLEKMTSQMIAASQAAGGFAKGMALWMSVSGSESEAPGKAIASLTTKIEALKKTREELTRPTLGNKINNALFGDVEDLDRQISGLSLKRDLLKKIQADQALADSSYGNEGKGKVTSSRDGILGSVASAKATKTKQAEYTDLLTPAAEAYARTIRSIADAENSAQKSAFGMNTAQEALYDLMNDPLWQQMPDTWQEMVRQQAEFASQTIKAADEAARLKAMLDATPSAELERAQQDMVLLADALERGAITAEQFVEASNRRLGLSDELDKQGEKIKEQKSLAEELGLTFSSAAEDAIVNWSGFSNALKGVESDLIRLAARKTITEPLFKAISSYDWSQLFSPNADGGVYSSPSLSAFSGGVYSSPHLFKFANGAGVFGEAGPEAIMPLKRGPDGKLGVAGSGASVTVNLVESPGSGQGGTTSTSTGANGEQIITVIVERIKGDMIRDVGSGGPFASAMEGQYNLNRAAGAWR